jgi:hypothetical protein
MKCYFCSEEIDDNAPVCPWCGRRQERVKEKKLSKKEQLDQFILAMRDLLGSIDSLKKLLNDQNNHRIWIAFSKSNLMKDFPTGLKNITQSAGSFTLDNSGQSRSSNLNQNIRQFQSWLVPINEVEFVNLLELAQKLSLDIKTTIQQSLQPTDIPDSASQAIGQDVKNELIDSFSGLLSVLASIIQKMEGISQRVTELSNDLEALPSELKTHLERDSRPTKVCGVCYGKKEFPCSGCYESGACQLCNGQGEIKAMVGVNKDGDEIIRKTPCPACKGSGLCTICHGTKIMKCTECGGTGLASG